MAQLNRKQLATVFLVSPIVLGIFVSFVQPGDEGFLNFMAVLAIIFGIPFIAVTGTLISYLTRKSKQADEFFLLGFGVPTVLVCLWELELIQPVYRVLLSS